MKQVHLYNELVRCYYRSRRKFQRLAIEGKNLRKQNILQKRIARLFKTLTGLQRALKLGMATAAISAGMLLFQPNASWSQSEITFGPAQTNPFGLTGGGSPAFADLDGDGDMDLMAAGFLYFQNIGTPTAPAFAAAETNPFGLTGGSSPAFADLDGDGDMDLMDKPGGSFLYFQNTGTPTAPAFAAPITNPFGLGYNIGQLSDPVFADLDGDGDQDMLCGQSEYGYFWYIQNIGTATAPAFADPQDNPFGLWDCCYSSTYYKTPAFADLDRDGDFDVFNGEGDIKYFKNIGTKFAPDFRGFGVNPFGLTFGWDPAFADLDGDGDMDLMNSSFSYSENTTICTGLAIYPDADGDGYGDAATRLFVADCIVPDGYTLDNTDCNDENAAVHALGNFYIDADSDTYGAGSVISICYVEAPDGYSINDTDCNDGNATINPGANEIANVLDDNCNGIIDEGFGSDIWTQKGDFGGTARYLAVGFSINNKGYIGTGGDGAYRKDFWEYDPTTDSWSQKADFGGTARYGAVGFSIGNKGYIGTGTDGTLPFENDFWEYDPIINTWTQKSDFPGGPRLFAVGFSIGSKGYLATGYNYNGGQFLHYNDFWEYDPANDAWTPKDTFPGEKRERAVGFSIGSKGYIGTGSDNSFNEKNDFWEYDPYTNNWTQKADFGGANRYGAVGFSIESKGYLGMGLSTSGYRKDFWEYDPAINSWIQRNDIGGDARAYAVGFVIGDKGYLGTGQSTSGYLKDFWKYGALCITPSGLTTTNITGMSAELKWDDVADAKRYKVRYKVAGTSEWSKITDIKFNSKVITGLTPNTLYFWAVKTVCSVDPIDASDWSEKQTFTTGEFRIGDEQEVSLELYPNPVSESFTLDLQLGTTTDQSATIYLLNALGQTVHASVEVVNGELNKVITMPGTATSGWYLVRVVLSDQVIEQKLLYQK